MKFVGSGEELVVVILGRDCAGNLLDLVERVRAHHDRILYIDDGSRDDSVAVARGADVRVLELGDQGGISAALHAGLVAAWELNYAAAITIVAGAGHDPVDLPKFIQAFKDSPEALLLGQRDFARLGARSGTLQQRAGWVSRATGVGFDDPLCGYRCYPLAATMRLEIDSRSPSFELEVLVRGVAVGIPMAQIAISTSEAASPLSVPLGPLALARLGARLAGQLLRPGRLLAGGHQAPLSPL